MKRPLTYFLVDDDSDDTALFEEVMQQVDPAVTVQIAGDGQQALDTLFAQSQTPNLIFLDLNMPRLDGKQCLSQLKMDDRLSRIPVIMYTTSSQSQDIEETMLKGAICFITKPSSVSELKKILTTITQGMPDRLEPAIRSLSNSAATFIVC